LNSTLHAMAFCVSLALAHLGPSVVEFEDEDWAPCANLDAPLPPGPHRLRCLWRRFFSRLGGCQVTLLLC